VQRYRSRVRFIVVTDALEDEIVAFFEKQPFLYEQARLDPAAGQRAFGVGYPRHVVITPDGVVVFSQAGGSKERAKDLETVLTTLLNR